MASTVGTIPKPVRMDSFGVLRVGRTRISLDSVVYDFKRGADAAEIQQDFDTLSLAEVHAAIAYYLHNTEEVDAYLIRQEQEYERKREQNLREFPPRVTRKMLLARKNGTENAAA